MTFSANSGLLLSLALAGEIVLLARNSEDGVPECSVGVDFLAFAHGVFDRHMREGVVHAAHDHVGLAGHACVYGGFGELEAENGVGALSRDATHHVARVKVLDVDFFADLVEMFLDFACQEFADVVLQNVAACILAFRLILEEFLSGAFGDGHHGVRLAAAVTAFERLEETVECKGYFGDQADIHDGRGQGCVGSNKAR